MRFSVIREIAANGWKPPLVPNAEPAALIETGSNSTNLGWRHRKKNGAPNLARRSVVACLWT